jgi:hypothetical protein
MRRRNWVFRSITCSAGRLIHRRDYRRFESLYRRVHDEAARSAGEALLRKNRRDRRLRARVCKILQSQGSHRASYALWLDDVPGPLLQRAFASLRRRFPELKESEFVPVTEGTGGQMVLRCGDRYIAKIVDKERSRNEVLFYTQLAPGTPSLRGIVPELLFCEDLRCYRSVLLCFRQIRGRRPDASDPDDLRRVLASYSALLASRPEIERVRFKYDTLTFALAKVLFSFAGLQGIPVKEAARLADVPILLNLLRAYLAVRGALSRALTMPDRHLLEIAGKHCRRMLALSRRGGEQAPRFVHGDLSATNMLICEETRKAVFLDWERCGKSMIGVDVSAFLAAHQAFDDRHALHSCLEQQRGALSAQQLASIPFCLGLRWINKASTLREDELTRRVDYLHEALRGRDRDRDAPVGLMEGQRSAVL